MREDKDSSNLILFDQIPGYKTALFNSYQEKRWHIHYTDGDMAEALANTKGAFGLITSPDIIEHRPKIIALSLDGIHPTIDNMLLGKYKPQKELSFIYIGQPSERVTKFLDFVFSSDAQRVLNDWGALPIER